MQGQLWQECSRCGEEPVCVDCERCETHCTCAQARSDAALLAAFEKRWPDLRRRVQEHQEQGAQEH